jgi:hypothetical protein
MSLSPKAKDRVRLLLAAGALAIVALLVIWYSVVLTPEQYRNRIDWKWARFTVVTIFFMGYCLKTYWKARKHLGFWIVLLGVFVLHFLGVGYFYYAGAGLPLLVFGPTVALEWTLLALIVYHLLGIAPSTR